MHSLHRPLRVAWLAFSVSAVCAAGPAPSTPESVRLFGALPKPMTFARKELDALGGVKAPWADHGTTRAVVGVPLDKVLAAAGFAPGPMGKDVPKREKRAGWKMALRVTGSDGYQALFSCAELSEAMGATRALLVWEVDGQPLGNDVGPFRLVVLTDKEPSRSVHNVATLELLDLRS